MNTSAALRASLRSALLIGILVSPVEAQQQTQQQAPITGEFLIRHEWNDNFFSKPDPVPSSRTRFQLRPRFEAATQSMRLGLGADINYSKDDNLKPEDVPLPLGLIRDNYDSRSIRLDLAYFGLNLSPGFSVDVGRMRMPFRLTEMIWDRDLRVQGASAVWTLHQGETGEPTARVSGIYSRGSHVFTDSADADGSSTGEGVTVKGGSLDLGFGSGKRIDISGSYLSFDKLNLLESKIRRQNTRVGGALTREYEVIDLTLRLRTDVPFPVQVILDGATNRKAEDQKNGFWGTLVLGSLLEHRVRAEYTYAEVDRDVTVAAYAGDDFFWGTGWKGHRAELAVAQSPKSSLHLIGQLQQFKDSANPLERAHNVRRLRIEARRTF